MREDVPRNRSAELFDTSETKRNRICSNNTHAKTKFITVVYCFQQIELLIEWNETNRYHSQTINNEGEN